MSSIHPGTTIQQPVLHWTGPRPVVCAVWRLRWPIDRLPCWFGGNCRDCAQDVAVPLERKDEPAVCIYCAMGRGILLEIDVPLGEPLIFAEGWESSAC
jgi:hypothetical protein